MTKTEVLIQAIQRATANHYEPLPIVLSRGAGGWVQDVEGKWYQDWLSCYGAASLGHNHPKLNEAFFRQLEKGLAVCSNAFYHENQFFNARLVDFCGFEKVLCSNSGAEAVESAIKLARKWFSLKHGPKGENKAEIIVAVENFHGRTVTIVSFSSEPLYRFGFGPYTPGFTIVPYGDLDALEQALEESPYPAGVLIEPRQGEGGVHLPPHGYLTGAKKLCHMYDATFMLDEIQTGFGRTGEMFAWQHEGEGAKPDVLILAKTLGSYYPVSAILTDAERMDAVFTPGTHGSTFANNPLACALGMAVLDIFTEEKEFLLSNTRTMGALLLEDLRSIKNPLIKEVRGEGLFIGMEFTPETGRARKFCEALKDCTPGLLCTDAHNLVLRFLPRLGITEDELRLGVQKIKLVLES